MERQPNFRYNILQPLLLASCIAVGMMAGYKLNEIPDPGLIDVYAYPEGNYNETGTVEELIRFIENRYIDSIDREELTREAIYSVFSKLDPYSDYLAPEDFRDYNQKMEGSFFGLGLDIKVVKDTLYVSNILSGSPASKSGIQKFDKLIAIDGDTLTKESIGNVKTEHLFSQRIGTEVSLVMKRGSQYFKADLTVEEIQTPTVHIELLPEVKACLVKIDYFAKGTYREFMEGVEKYFEKGQARHIILDLRNNPGGYIPEATNLLCQIFKEKDRILFTTKNRADKVYEYKSTGKQFFDLDKIVVLVNENTASASEIVAGSIQDWDRGIIIGTRTYGKGLVQEQYKLKNGGAIRLSVEKYYLPSGRSIQRRDYLQSRTVPSHENLEIKNTSDIKEDAVKFKTLTLQRQVDSESGIKPDMEIVGHRSEANSGGEIQEYLSDFVFGIMIQKKGAIPSDGKMIPNWQVPESMVQEFNAFLDSELGPGASDALDGQWLKGAIKEHIAEILLSDKSSMAENAQIDPLIKSAISVIREGKSLRDIK